MTARGAAQDGEGTERGIRRWSGGCQEDPSRSRNCHEPEESAHGIREHAAYYAGRCQRCRQNDTRLLSSGTVEIPIPMIDMFMRRKNANVYSTAGALDQLSCTTIFQTNNRVFHSRHFYTFIYSKNGTHIINNEK